MATRLSLATVLLVAVFSYFHYQDKNVEEPKVKQHTVSETSYTIVVDYAQSVEDHMRQAKETKGYEYNPVADRYSGWSVSEFPSSSHATSNVSVATLNVRLLPCENYRELQVEDAVRKINAEGFSPIGSDELLVLAATYAHLGFYKEFEYSNFLILAPGSRYSVAENSYGTRGVLVPYITSELKKGSDDRWGRLMGVTNTTGLAYGYNWCYIAVVKSGELPAWK